MTILDEIPPKSRLTFPFTLNLSFTELCQRRRDFLVKSKG